MMLTIAQNVFIGLKAYAMTENASFAKTDQNILGKTKNETKNQAEAKLRGNHFSCHNRGDCVPAD